MLEPQYFQLRTMDSMGTQKQLRARILMSVGFSADVHGSRSVYVANKWRLPLTQFFYEFHAFSGIGPL